MAYGHYQIERDFVANATAAAPIVSLLTSGTGEKARVAFGHRCIIKRVNILMYASSTTPKPVISLRLATKAGATSATGQQIRLFTVASGKAAGSVMRTSQMNTVAKSGQELVFHVLTAATKALKVRATVLVEPNWELGANETGPSVFTATA